ncbi:MAG: metal-dependent hydrolase, partial [Chitinophagales bacterium]|nr:metal-dependent hydrolase [Chitinophagales bacterium]
EPSLQILTGLHQRWTVLLNSLNATQRQRTFKHPQHTKLFTIDIATAMYAWHSNHHLAHIQNLVTKMGW